MALQSCAQGIGRWDLLFYHLSIGSQFPIQLRVLLKSAESLSTHSAQNNSAAYKYTARLGPYGKGKRFQVGFELWRKQWNDAMVPSLD